ncbi:trehalase family glycosidase [Luteolibacter flavescens]|uniref:Trehalase family glycosidase n=1 Tax=Luteolibacter flavescens TaxID=1859460 RepID=A0ABT3FTN3_9BACT|nr:trehalase family glycosidase [Luteolibacter flavescens]MCW1886679.1 trehalase family glycosidase [Luteolibacter flavescens]
MELQQAPPRQTSTTRHDARREVVRHLDRLRPQVIMPARGFIRYPYCIPGGFYEQQWDWDGFFISCHLASRDPARPEYLKYWTLNVLNSVLPDGDVAACISTEGVRARLPSLRLKPFLAQGAELAGRLGGDDSWLVPHYDEIVRIVTRREASHRDAATGLYAWEDAMSSGADNNVAVTNDPEARRKMAAADVNAFQYREYEALSRLADRLGHAEDARRFATMASKLSAAMMKHLWSPDDVSFWTMDLRDGTWRRRVSYSNFVPLWAGLVPRVHAREMIRRYLWNADHLLSPHGLRSLSARDPDYNNVNMIDPHSNWQGPIWPIVNYFYFTALVRYGFADEAEELVDRLCRLYLDDIEFCGSLHENYDAETGRPLAPSADQSATGREGGFVGWNLLLQDMIEVVEGREHPLFI